MSKANSPIKVLRTVFKRVTNGWTKQNWHYHDAVTGKNFVCLEGGIYGYCPADKHVATEAQKRAIAIVEEIIAERHGYSNIPNFNDAIETSQEDVLEVIKLAIIRLETTPDGLDDEEIDDLLEFKDKEKSKT